MSADIRCRECGGALPAGALAGLCPVCIFYSQEDEGYIADIPDLRFCSAFGNTPGEALAELEKAKAAWIEAARAEGKRIPKPCYRPAIYQTSRA
jgi:predicted RNase H-like HicB family nuclease